MLNLLGWIMELEFLPTEVVLFLEVLIWDPAPYLFTKDTTHFCA